MTTNPSDAIGTNAAYNGRTSPRAFNDVLSLFEGRGILSGWQCLPSNNMVVTLGGQNGVQDVAIAQDNAGNNTTIDNRLQEPVEVEIAPASNTSTSTDYLVAYVNNPPEGTPLAADNPGACGLIDVRGSGAAAPTEAQIRAAITADGGTGVTAYYVVLATIAVAAGTTAITAANITQGKESLSSQAVQHPYFANNLAVENDTPAGWYTALGGKDGHYWIYYNEANKFAGQIHRYGVLEIFIVSAGTNVYQRWHTQADGPSYERTGNVNGWNNSASVTGSAAWKQVLGAGDYGLGGYSVLISGTNLNSLENKSGFYVGENLGNAPTTQAGHWYYIEQQVFRPTYILQRATSMFDSTVTYVRVLDNGNWEPWTILGGDLYTTSEHIVGKWIDGKPIYRKVVTGPATNSSSMVTSFSAGLSTSVVNEILPTSCASLIELNEGQFAMPGYGVETNAGFMLTFSRDAGNVTININRNRANAWTGRIPRVVIEYTKK